VAYSEYRRSRGDCSGFFLFWIVHCFAVCSVHFTNPLLLTLNDYLRGWATLAEVQREIEEDRARQAHAQAKKNAP